jgi:hypothetical protein
MVLDTKTYWLTDRQSQCNFDFDFDSGLDERELALENRVEFWRVGIPKSLNKKWQEGFVVIWSDSSCVKIRCQETDSEDILKT